MSIDIQESLFFDNAKLRKVTVFDALTVAAGATGAWSDDVMPYLVGGEGYVTAQFVITGSGTFSVEAQGSADGTTYGDIYDADGIAYGTASSPLSSGLAAANTGRCRALKFPLLGGLKFRVKETGAANSVTVTMYLITKAD
ncbi:MAG: hypothetical protein HGA87_00235 [Desulfobulbaceae bacterium]|nr:hypothetical protein [Desulfobulbaceae bacterium]